MRHPGQALAAPDERPHSCQQVEHEELEPCSTTHVVAPGRSYQGVDHVLFFRPPSIWLSSDNKVDFPRLTNLHTLFPPEDLPGGGPVLLEAVGK